MSHVLTRMTKQSAMRHSVNAPGVTKSKFWSLYDKLPYVDNSSTELTFFAEKQGTNSKTYQHTNLDANGCLPAGNFFVIHTIEFLIIPGKTGASLLLPSLTAGAQAAAAIVNDEYQLRTSGVVELWVDNKMELRDGPLLKFPPAARFEVTGAMSDVTTAGGNLQTRNLIGAVIGPVYRIKPITLLPNQQFYVKARWPDGAQNISADAHIQCSLNGELFAP